ncbi:protein kinase superfamily protein [Actinidia rufa]|uniref:mitogen-activated protein kinase kinase kinase n=1 Tax=Actinidia rufa TaxID=165716 RepID=A0A7J0EEW8_9ERIC|nr:protein kinase superfamily protein [Actinidia rufa]
MLSWWGKSSSKEAKKKTSKEGIIDSLQRRFRTSSESKPASKSVGSRRCTNDAVSEKGSQSVAVSWSPSPSKQVSRCQSFIERPRAQPLPLPNLQHAGIGRTDSGISVPSKPRSEKGSKPFLPLSRSECVRSGPEPAEVDGDVIVASFSSECSIDSDDPADSSQRSPLASDYENGSRTAAGSPSSMMAKVQSVTEIKLREATKPANQVSPLSSRRRPLSNHVPNLQVPCHGTFSSALDSSMSSPSRSPMRTPGTEPVINSAFWTGKTYVDLPLFGSGHCSSPGSGQNSGHNSMGGDMSGQLLWQPSRGSPEYSPNPSPRMTSPGPSSRIHSGAVSPLHPRAVGPAPDDGKQQSHRLPLPPVTILNSSPFSHPNSAATSPSVPRSPGRAENPTSPGFRWKKGKLLGRGTFGHVYVGFNSDSGESCAMKEVTLLSDDAKSKESAKQLGQEIALLSRLRHPNIVQYYGSETIAGQSCPLSFKGSPYWMAPEVIKNLNGCNLMVDIWSLGCTVLEMATAKPPWSNFEGVAAMFKIGNSKDLPAIPDHLSDDGKDFVRQCLQRNPLHRPTAAKLLEHPFVKNAAPLEKPIIGPELSDPPAGVTTGVKSQGIGHTRNGTNLDSGRLAIHSSRVSKSGLHSSEIHIPRNISCPVSPIGSPLLHSRSPQHLNGILSPSPISSPHTTSGSSTPLTGGSANILYHQLNQSVYLQEGFGIKSPNHYTNSPSYHSPHHDIFRGMQSGSQVFRELLSSENEALGKHFGRPIHGEQYDGQSVLADRVSQQLLRDHAKLSPSLDLSFCSPFPDRMSGM